MTEENKLKEIIERLEDFEEAADALLNLKRTNPKETEKLTYEILLKKKGDIFFQATAYDILYSLNSLMAISFARIELSSLHPYLLETIINNITADSAIIQNNETMKSFIAEIKLFLRSSEKLELESLKESIDWFKKTYGG